MGIYFIFRLKKMQGRVCDCCPISVSVSVLCLFREKSLLLSLFHGQVDLRTEGFIRRNNSSWRWLSRIGPLAGWKSQAGLASGESIRR